MTYIETVERSGATDHEVRAAVWGYNTLRPPRLTPVGIVRDLMWELHRFRAARLGVRTTCAFLILRVLQRVAYNAGWRMGR